MKSTTTRTRTTTSMISWLVVVVGSIIALSSLHFCHAGVAALGINNNNITTSLRGQQQQHRSLEDLGTFIDPPNAEQIGYGYNCLIGQTPAEQRQALAGAQLFRLTAGDDDRTVRIINGYIMYDQFSDMSTTSSCATTDITDDVWWATSTSSLSSQVSKSSYGVDQSIDLGVQVGPAVDIPVAATAATTVRAALVFGNSESSTTAVYEMNSGRSYSWRMELVGVDIARSLHKFWCPRCNTVVVNLHIVQGPLGMRRTLMQTRVHATAEDEVVLLNDKEII